MPFWSTQTLKTKIPANQLIVPYDEARVIHSAYEMGVGSEAFITSNPSDRTQVSAGAKIVIPQGQFGLLVTRESVRIPDNAIAFISIRARIKFQGLVNVSGFHVDPGYSGHLKFAVYNAGSQPVILDQDQPIIMIWFADLDQSDDDPYDKKPAIHNLITANDVARIQGDVVSPAELKTQLEKLRVDLDKKFHATEQLRLKNRALILAIASVIAITITVTLALVKAIGPG